MTGPIQPEVDGEFYIDNVTSNFWLRENAEWDKKGRLVRADIVGLISAGPYPFTDGFIFELAIGKNPVAFSQAFSADISSVAAEYPTASACSIIFTDNLAGYLSSGTDIICTASLGASSQIATLEFNDVIVPAFQPLWLVMPSPADVAMAGLRASFAGDPQ